MLQEKKKKKKCDKLIVMLQDTIDTHVNLFQSINIHINFHTHSVHPSQCLVSNRVWKWLTCINQTNKSLENPAIKYRYHHTFI